MYWGSGINREGESELVGPSDLEEAIYSEVEFAGLTQTRVFQAENRDAAERMVQRQHQRQPNMVAQDEPAPELPIRFRAVE